MEQTDLSNSDLAYDLRQRYAKIVGDHLEDLSIARRDRDYSSFFRSLEDLYTVTQHKFKEKTIKVKEISIDKIGKIVEKEETISYDLLRARIIKISNKYSNAWLGNGTDSGEIAEIETSLRKAEMFLYSKMDEYGMFGAKRDTEGLI